MGHANHSLRVRAWPEPHRPGAGAPGKPRGAVVGPGRAGERGSRPSRRARPAGDAGAGAPRDRDCRRRADQHRGGRVGGSANRDADPDPGVAGRCGRTGHQAIHPRPRGHRRADRHGDGHAHGSPGQGRSGHDAEPARRATDYTYDGLNRLRSETQYPSWPATTPTLVTGYTYDGNGNRLTLKDPLGQTTTYGYDPLNRLTSLTYSDGVTPNVAY
ncbi:MAG TPA: hypothetical protein VNL16_03220, partial [Chloroflexota bacterium]|nr:hypothetical protein [Chloroflexota bacterium]